MSSLRFGRGKFPRSTEVGEAGVRTGGCSRRSRPPCSGIQPASSAAADDNNNARTIFLDIILSTQRRTANHLGGASHRSSRHRNGGGGLPVINADVNIRTVIGIGDRRAFERERATLCGVLAENCSSDF